jgi:predicted nuclease of predicted toxin-antitoxin system
VTVTLYFDHNVQASAAWVLRTRGIDAITAFEDGTDRSDDESLLRRANELGRVLVTHDHDFFVIASQWNRVGRRFTGIVFAQQEALATGTLIEQLEFVALVGQPADLQDRVEFLPLR